MQGSVSGGVRVVFTAYLLLGTHGLLHMHSPPGIDAGRRHCRPLAARHCLLAMLSIQPISGFKLLWAAGIGALLLAAAAVCTVNSRLV